MTMSCKDPIVEEIHIIRENIARAAGYDLERMLEAARQRQVAGGAQAVRLPPRKTKSVAPDKVPH